MIISAMPHCCGLREIGGLSQYNAAGGRRKTNMEHLADMFLLIYQPSRDYPNGRTHWRYAIFTEAYVPGDQPQGYGSEFADFIKAKGLGLVVEADGPQVNPNSGNMLRVWIWTVDHDTTRPIATLAYEQLPKLEPARTKQAAPVGRAVPINPNPRQAQVSCPSPEEVAQARHEAAMRARAAIVLNNMSSPSQSPADRLKDMEHHYPGTGGTRAPK